MHMRADIVCGLLDVNFGFSTIICSAEWTHEAVHMVSEAVHDDLIDVYVYKCEI